ALMATLPYGMEERRDGVVGLSYAMRQVAQLILMCDRQDIGISIGAGEEGTVGAGTVTAELDEPRIFVYDAYPGGIGFSETLFGAGPVEAERVEPRTFGYDAYPGGIGLTEPLFEMNDELVARTRELIAGCPCEHGCPGCVGRIGETGPEAKPVALLILDRLSR